MTHEPIDKRVRILVIEDIATTRNMYARNLELHGEYRIDGAADLESALDAVEKRTYQVALVDIMLHGAKDTANRDGVVILERLRDLGEGTQSIVLTGQNEPQLVREFLKECEAFDYLDKAVLSDRGLNALFDLVDRAAQTSPVGREPSWDAVIATLANGDEPTFVSEVMGQITFKGGFENLRRNLETAVRHLMPLLPSRNDGDTALRFDEARGGFAARFWSKGQGCAVDLLLLGSNSNADGANTNLMFEREKGGLKVVVSRLPEESRESFAARADA